MSGFDLSNFLAAFFDEARDRLISINRGLVEFESETLDDEGLVALRRDAHTIKGSALMLGVTDVGGVAHLFEDAMENLIQHPELRVPRMTQFLYDLHDLLDERLEEVDTEPRLDAKKLREDYEQLLHEVRSDGGNTEKQPDVTKEEPSLIGADEAASWKEHRDETGSTVKPEAVTTTTESPPEVDIEAMMPEGMFVEDPTNEVLTAAATEVEDAKPSPISDDPSVITGGEELPDYEHPVPQETKASDEFSIEVEENDEALAFGGLDDAFSDADVQSLLGDMNDSPDLFVYGDDIEDETPTAHDSLLPETINANVDEPETDKNKPQKISVASEENVQQIEKQRKANIAAYREAELQTVRAELQAEEAARKEAEAKAAEERRKAEETARKEAEAKAAEERRKAEEAARKEAEAKAAEERRKAEEAARKAKEKARKQALADEVSRRKQEAATLQQQKEPVVGQQQNHQRAEPGKENANRFRPQPAVAEGAARKSSGQRQASGRFLRVDAARLEELSSYVVELSTESSRGEEQERQFHELQREFRELRLKWRELESGMGQMSPEDQASLMQSMHRSFERGLRGMSRYAEAQRFAQLRSEMMLKELRDQVLSLMLRPLDTIFSTFPRAVRDVAVKLGKRVKLVIDGSDTEIDQGIAEALVEPLVHLLNNAVSHGIEMPEERVKAGKPPIAQVSIIARQSGSEIHIEVVDDGRGLDVELIKATAVERGVTTQVEADEMDSAELLEMIFRPGFSTKKEVSDVSGRGIGMNIVQDTVRRLTGSIRIDSEKGQGTRFMLSLPVSIAVQHALVFRMADQRFGMLIHLIEQIVPLANQKVEKGQGGKDFMHYGYHQVALVDMRRMLAGDDEANISDHPYVIIAEHIEGFVGIVVDEMYDEMEIVVRDLDPYIKRYQPQGLMGTTIAADGSVLILLEPYGIKEMGRTAPDQAISVDVAEEDKMDFSVLLVEDSLIARQIEKSVFESIGFTVETAIDGLDGLEKLAKNQFDLIVTDLEMPRLDGFGFVRRVRNQDEYEDLPIMVISTRESAEDRMRALEGGADAYMIKQQLQGDKILETVKSLLGAVPAA